MTDTSIRRSLALRSGTGSSALRPSTVGYADFSGVVAEYLSFDRAPAASILTIEYAVKVKVDALGVVSRLSGWAGGSLFQINAGNTLSISLTSAAATQVGNAASNATVPAGVATGPVWLRAKLTWTTAVCEYWYSTDPTDVYEQVATWTSIGTPQTGTNAAAALLTNVSIKPIVGNLAVSGTASLAGNIYAYAELINGVKTAWFVSSDIPRSPATSFVASGGGPTWTGTGAGLVFVPTQNYQGALRSDYVYNPSLLGLQQDTILAVYGVNHHTARVSYQSGNIPAHPTLGGFQEAMVVRSTAGFPATNLDGAMVLRYLANDPSLAGGLASVVDSELLGQQWYYYALFVRYDASSGWFKVAEQSWLSPARYGYPERLWRGFPNYYRRIDQGVWLDPGYLRRICNVIGFEFDVLRSYAATVGDVWDFERISAKLLPEAGAALGLVKQSANGDRRLRTLAGNIMALRKQKGTTDGVEGYVAAQTGWPTRVYEGINLLHRTQHTEWPYSFTAQDGSATPATDNHPGWTSSYGLPPTYTLCGQLSRQIAAGGEGNAAPIAMPDGSFYLRLTNNTGGNSQLVFQYGHGSYAPHSAIPVIEGHSYIFSTAMKAYAAATAVTVSLHWINELGVQIGAASTTILTAIGTTWVRQKTAAGTCPVGAKYCSIRFYSAATLPNTTGHINIFKPMLVDLAWRPEGIPTLANNVPLSSNLAADLGTFVHQDYYEAPREVKINVYPMRTNLALNSDFLLNNQPAGAWATYDSPSYAQLPVAYSSYADIVDAEVGDSETTYLDMAQGLAPLVGSVPTLTFDTTNGGRLTANKASVPFGFTLMHTFFPATDLGGMSAAVVASTNVVPNTDAPYLTPTVSTVTTPDPGVLPPDDGVLLFKIRGPLTASEGSVAGQMAGTPNDGWEIRRGYTFGTLYPDRIAWIDAEVGGPAGTVYVSHVAGAPPTGKDEIIAMAWHWDAVAKQRRLTVSMSPDGMTWSPLPSRLWNAIGATLDSPAVLRIGGTTTSTGIFNGRIYWVEMRTGTNPAAGDLLWRFDAADYPGTGTSWTDPRGRTWTMSTSTAITRPNPGTTMSMAFEWYTAASGLNRINVPPDPPGSSGVPLRTQSPTYLLTTTPTRYEVVNAQPPANALYGRLMLIFSNTVTFNAVLENALIEDAPYPESYFNGDWNDGDDGDFFYAIGKGYTGAAHLSPSVYYQQFRHFASGVSGSDSLSQLMPYLLSFRKPFKVITAGTTPTGLYNAIP